MTPRRRRRPRQVPATAAAAAEKKKRVRESGGDEGLTEKDRGGGSPFMQLLHARPTGRRRLIVSYEH